MHGKSVDAPHQGLIGLIGLIGLNAWATKSTNPHTRIADFCWAGSPFWPSPVLGGNAFIL
jgi:hypothetical protein